MTNLIQIIENAEGEFGEKCELHVGDGGFKIGCYECDDGKDANAIKSFLSEKIKEVWFESRKATIQEYDLDK